MLYTNISSNHLFRFESYINYTILTSNIYIYLDAHIQMLFNIADCLVPVVLTPASLLRITMMNNRWCFIHTVLLN